MTDVLQKMVDGVYIPLTTEEIAQIELAKAAAAEESKAKARVQRDYRLAQSDWVTARAFESNSEIPQAWRDYRQALRDVPQQPGFPENIQWPVKPE